MKYIHTYIHTYGCIMGNEYQNMPACLESFLQTFLHRNSFQAHGKYVWKYILKQCHCHYMTSCPLLPMMKQIANNELKVEGCPQDIGRRGSKQTNKNVRRKTHSVPFKGKWPAWGLSDIHYSSMQIKASLGCRLRRIKASPKWHLLGLW